MSALDWPPGFDRTTADERDSTTRFKSTRGDTVRALRKCIRMMDADQYRLSVDSGGSHTHGDGAPKASANPSDPGAVVRWRTDGREYAVACDHWTDVDDNLRTIYLWLDETRKRNARPVTTGADAFAAAALPSGDDEAIVGAEPPHVVLGVAEDAPERVVKAAARELKKQHHPDNDGDRAAFQRVVAAEEAMLDA